MREASTGPGEPGPPLYLTFFFSTGRSESEKSEARLADFPDLPTFKELSHPELVGTTWFALAGPPALPDAIATRINRGVADAVGTPDIQARFRRDGFIARPMGLDEFKQFIVAENARWRATIERTGLERKRQ